MTIEKITLPLIVAGMCWCGTWLWFAEARLKRIEYALGIEEVLPAKRIAEHGLAQKASR